MKRLKLVAGLFSVCAALTVTAAAASAQNQAIVSCHSEDDGQAQVTLVRVAPGVYTGGLGLDFGQSTPFTQNPAIKLIANIQGLSRVAPGSGRKAAPVNVAVVNTASGAWQGGAGFTTVIERDGQASFSLFSAAGVLDPEGLYCHIQLIP
jgi:hypothetical protein